MAIKVTFYNDVNFAKDDTANKSVFNESIKPAAGNFSDGGIYFTPVQNITNTEKPAPAHIIQKSYIYTLGSYVVNDPNISQTVITKPNADTTENTLSENNCYVVTDIISDPYHKLLTVKKTNIKLGKIVDTASNAAVFMGNLGKTSKTINIGSYSLTVSISSEGVLTLSNSKLLADEIKYEYKKGNTGTFTYFDSGKVFNLSKDIYTLQFTTKTNIASANIRCDTAENITFGDPTTQLSCEYHRNNNSISPNIVKVSIPASGWDASTYFANSYTFSVYIKTTGGKVNDGNNTVEYNSGEWNVNVTISKTPSPLVLNEPTLAVTDTEQILHNHIFTESNKNDSTGGILTWKMTAMSAQNVKDGWGTFDSTNEKYKMGSAYEMKNAEITVNCTYQCIVNTYSIYHQVEKQGKLKINGGKQWTVNLNANGGTVDSTTVKNYYEGDLTLPTPTRSATGSATYTFNGWHTAATGGTQVSSPLKAGVTNVTWNNHAVTLYAHWNETTITKYYWYVGWTKPTSLDHLKTLATGTHNGNSLGGETSKSSGEKLLTNSPEINNPTNTLYYVVIPSGYNIYDATLPNDPITNDSFSEVTDVTIANHKVYVNNDTARSVSGLEIY